MNEPTAQSALMSDEERRVAVIQRWGRCTCTAGDCDEDSCGFCGHIDPEWDCPHDPAIATDVVAGAAQNEGSGA